VAASIFSVVTLEAAQRLPAYQWPGNIREPENVVHHAILLCSGGQVCTGDLHFRSIHGPSGKRSHFLVFCEPGRCTLHDKISPMAIKKSDLYSSLWASCDELRGGMDASQHADMQIGLGKECVMDKSHSIFFDQLPLETEEKFTVLILREGHAEHIEARHRKIFAHCFPVDDIHLPSRTELYER
jgi:hypothetical protein